MAQPLDAAGLKKKIWLVKVPNAVGQAWRAACDKAMNANNIDDEEPAISLGTMRTEAGEPGEGKTNVSLIVEGVQGGAASYKMVPLSVSQGGLVMAVSYKAGEKPGDPPTQIRAEGTVDQSFNVAPVAVSDNNGQFVVDSQYRAMSRERTMKASVKPRQVAAYEDTRENYMNLLASRRAADLSAKRKGEEAKKSREDNKRVRADTAALERMLFALFERQPHWTFVQLQSETKQPGPHLKAVLEGIAVLNKRGPMRDLYELKKEYQLGGAGGGEEKPAA